MTSFRGNLFRIAFGTYNYFGWKSKKSFVERIRKLSAKGINDLCPKGFEIIKETTASGTPYERVVKVGAPTNGRAIYFCHGGGYIVGLLFFYRMLATDFFEASGGGELILLDYSCAPEHKFPTQHDEALDLWRELTERLGYSPENIILGGDSAGANLALSLMQRLRDEGGPMPKAAFCISAWADTTGSGKSIVDNSPRDVMFGTFGKKLTEEQRLKNLDGELYSFVGDADRHHPYVSPVFGEYCGFPPMFFTVGGDEILLDDTMRIVEKLENEGIFVEYDVQPKMFHIYTLFGNLFPESNVSYQKLLKFISDRFSNRSEINENKKAVRN